MTSERAFRAAKRERYKTRIGAWITAFECARTPDHGAGLGLGETRVGIECRFRQRARKAFVLLYRASWNRTVGVDPNLRVGEVDLNTKETETGDSLRVQGQGYMVDVLTLANQTLSIFAEGLKCVWSGLDIIKMKNYTLSVDQFRPFILYFLLDSHQLMAVEIRIDGFAQRERPELWSLCASPGRVEGSIAIVIVYAVTNSVTNCSTLSYGNFNAKRSIKLVQRSRRRRPAPAGPAPVKYAPLEHLTSLWGVMTVWVIKSALDNVLRQDIQTVRYFLQTAERIWGGRAILIT
ncbi:hypothetical protein EVAR_92040_1 [Eumeta japonica]|uniref:Uncharacterized protein n=1 Tax=Eumeta variegata TaxID=151549 RepID=A0A4C1SYZ8_EUMVA|nr:hypothetical protein EVAR_92040_1 [Eumeta japonica]